MTCFGLVLWIVCAGVASEVCATLVHAAKGVGCIAVNTKSACQDDNPLADSVDVQPPSDCGGNDMAGLCEVTATFEFGFDYHEGGINGVYPKYRQQFTFPSPSTDVDFTADYCLVQRSKDEINKVIQCYNPNDKYKGDHPAVNPYKALEYKGPDPRPPAEKSSMGDDPLLGQTTSADNLMNPNSNDVQIASGMNEDQNQNEKNDDPLDEYEGYGDGGFDSISAGSGDPAVWYT